jgi:hypothetical protein
MRCLMLLLLPLFLGFDQEEGRIKDLIRKLDDVELEVREKATRDIIQEGTRALPALREALKSGSAEVRQRAESAIRAIENESKAREVCPPYKPLALKAEKAPIANLIAELEKQSGVRVVAAEGSLSGTAAVNAITVMQALDQICGAQERLTYAWTEPGLIRLAAERHPANPASYAEGFKIFIASLDVLRKTDYKEPTILGNFSIHATWEPRLKPLKRVRYEFKGATDDAGRAVEIGPQSMERMGAMGGGGVIFMAAGGVFGGEADTTGPQHFGFTNLHPEAKAIKSMTGQAIISFPLTSVPVTFEDPMSGHTQSVAEFTFRLERVNLKKSRVDITLTKTQGDVSGLKDEIAGRVDPASVVAVDTEGKEHAGDFGVAQPDAGRGMVVVGGMPGGVDGSKSMKFQAVFQTLEGRDIKSFRFRFVERLYEKVVPFEFKDVTLP